MSGVAAARGFADLGVAGRLEVVSPTAIRQACTRCPRRERATTKGERWWRQRERGSGADELEGEDEGNGAAGEGG